MMRRFLASFLNLNKIIAIKNVGNDTLILANRERKGPIKSRSDKTLFSAEAAA